MWRADDSNVFLRFLHCKEGIRISQGGFISPSHLLFILLHSLLLTFTVYSLQSLPFPLMFTFLVSKPKQQLTLCLHSKAEKLNFLFPLLQTLSFSIFLILWRWALIMDKMTVYILDIPVFSPNLQVIFSRIVTTWFYSFRCPETKIPCTSYYSINNQSEKKWINTWLVTSGIL